MGIFGKRSDETRRTTPTASCEHRRTTEWSIYGPQDATGGQRVVRVERRCDDCGSKVS